MTTFEQESFLISEARAENYCTTIASDSVRETTLAQCDQMWNKKQPNFNPRRLYQFVLKSNLLQNTNSKNHQIFGPLLKENLLTRTFKIGPIWSHCTLPAWPQPVAYVKSFVASSQNQPYLGEVQRINFKGLDSIVLLVHTNKDIFSCLEESKPVKLKTSCTVVLLVC